MNGFKSALIASTCALALALSGCGGGGSSSSVSSLTVPEKMSVVTADTSGISKPAFGNYKTNFAGLGKAFGDADTPYTTDLVDVFVFDPAMEPIDLVNEILCSVEQTRFGDMLNQGDYLALVDTAICGSGKAQEDGSSGQSAGGGKSTSYEKWVVNSSRASASAPQIIQFWIAENDGPSGETVIAAEVTITEGISTEKPFGDFVLNFEFRDPNNSNAVTGSGTLKTVTAPSGKVAYTMFMTEGTEQTPGAYALNTSYMKMLASVEMTPTGSEGLARTSMLMEGNQGGYQYTQSPNYSAVFNSTHMRRGAATTLANLDADTFASETCVDRANYNTEVWRYDLYHAADTTYNGTDVLGGDRVEVNSGFPFTYDNGSTDVYGHVGYWGMWIEDSSVTIPDGATITRKNYADNTTTDYTVLKAPGKLIRRTTKTLPLAKLSGITMDYWGEVDPDGAGGSPAAFGQYRVSYLTTSDTFPAGNGGGAVPSDGFYALSELTGWTETGPSTTDIVPDDITPASGAFLGLWANGLGGAVNFVGGQSNALFFEETFVGPEDSLLTNGTVNLHCYSNCLKSNIQASDVATWDGIYQTPATDVDTGVVTYTFNPADMTLRDGGVAVALGTGVSTDSTQHNWGMQGGDMVTTAVENTLTNLWDMQDPAKVTVTYRWETGSNDWNKLTAVSTGGSFVSFDPPVQFAYEHSTANDLNSDATYDGTTVRLNYGGNGDLWGIPWTVDQATGRWYAQFAIKDGTLMGPSGTEFVIKAREMEQSMLTVGIGSCAALSSASKPTAALPAAVDGAPNNALTIPTITVAPAVIGGVLQSS
ncbi:MAG: hypothetical protein ACE5FN_09175 [Leptospirillia bacterium]